jgi:hypothetical protein
MPQTRTRRGRRESLSGFKCQTSSTSAPESGAGRTEDLVWLEKRRNYSTGTSTGAPLSLIKKTTNFAGLVLLAFRPTT